MRIFTFFLIAGLLLCAGFTQSQERMLVRIDNPTRELVKEFTKDGYDVAAFKPDVFIDLVVDQNQYYELISEDYEVKIRQTETQILENLAESKGTYHTYTSHLQELQQIENDNPGLCKLYDIGDSRGKEYSDNGNSNYDNYNHEVWALKLSDNVDVDEDEPCVYYFGTHHAREPISLEVVMAILNHLLNNYGTDPDITYSIDNTQIWFVPLVNPDGHKIVLDGDDVWWRKNIRDNNGNGDIDPVQGWSTYPDGVDPNRNYGWEFGGQGASSDPGEQTYHGPSGFSEPETHAIELLMDAHHFVAGISYHSYGELVLYPYGYAESIVAPDKDALEGLANAMGYAIPAQGGGTYDPGPSWGLYPASGVTDDFAYGEHGIFSFTIELATEFIPPENQIDQIAQNNIQAAMLLLNRVNQETLTGHITDAQSGEPVVAEVYVHGIDDSGEYRKPYESNEDWGSYYRFLPSGTYSVTYSAFGYLPQTIDNISINSSSQTVMDVALQPAQSIQVTGTVIDADNGSPIDGATIQILETPVDPVTTNSSGQYTIPEIFEGTYDFRISKQGYATLIEEISVDAQSNVHDFELYISTAISFEEGNFTGDWQFGGSAPWTITTEDPYDGMYCAKSGNIGDQQETEMNITLDLLTGGDISFFRKVSSEASYDFLEFYIDDVIQDQWSGELGWEEVSYSVSSGTHTFKWVYDKDYSVSSGDDCAWVDFINLPPLATLNANAGGDSEICEGEEYQLTGSAYNYDYVEWMTSGDGTFDDPASLTPVYTPGSNDISNGQVDLSLTAYGGSASVTDDMTLTIHPIPVVTMEPFDDYCLNYPEFELTGGLPAGGEYSGPGVINGWFYPDEAGIGNHTINYSYVSPNGCENSEEENIYVDACTGLESLINGNEIRVFPNPSQGKFDILINNELSDEQVEIEIFNSLGALVYKDKIINFASSSSHQIDVSSLNPGIYYLIINTEEIKVGQTTFILH